MSGSTPPGSLPPEVPEEFAAAYRAAYERALAAQSEGLADEEEPATGSTDTDELPARRGRLVVGTHRTETYDDEPTMVEKVTRLPVVRARAARPAGAAADPRGVRRGPCVRRARSTDDDKPSSEPSVVMSEGGANKAQQPVTTQAPGKGAWDGKVERVSGVKREGDLHLAAGAGREPAPRSAMPPPTSPTAWPTRPGAATAPAIGKKITLQLPGKTAIGEVGLIPGYAKTDEASGADRYAENNRVTRVRWTIGDIVVDQRLNGSHQRPQPAAAAGAEERRPTRCSWRSWPWRRGRATRPRSARSSSAGPASDPVIQRSRAPS